MSPRFAGRMALLIAVLALVAGCARSDQADRQRHGAFYGGVGAGVP